MTAEEEKVYRQMFGDSIAGPVTLPGGGTVDRSGGDPYAGQGGNALRFDAPGGGYAVVPQASVVDESGNVTNQTLFDTIATGKTKEQRDQESFEAGKQQMVDNFGRNQRNREREQMIEIAKKNQAEGNLTVHDALILDLPIAPGTGSQQERVDRQYNQPKRGDIARQQALDAATAAQHNNMIAQAIRAGSLVPKLDEAGNVSGYVPANPVKPDVRNVGDSLIDVSDPNNPRPIYQGEGNGEQQGYQRRRQFQQDRNRTFANDMGDMTETADSYYRRTYNDDGTLKPEAQVRPDIEQHIDYLNGMAKDVGVQAPFARAGKKEEPAAGNPAPAKTAPKPGEVRNGYRFKGGDPAKRESWEKVS